MKRSQRWSCLSVCLGVCLASACSDDTGADEPAGPSAGGAPATGGTPARGGATTGGAPFGGAGGSEDGGTDGGVGDGGSEEGGSNSGGESGESGESGAAGSAGAAGGAPDGPWMGVACEPSRGGPVKPYFEVPGASGSARKDFFRLPFPNDILRSARGLDLDGFPLPGAGVVGIDPVALYVDALEQHEHAFGSDPTTFFRFTGALDPDTLVAGVTLHYVDVTEGAAPGDPAELEFHYGAERTRYVCDDWLAVRRPLGAPLRPGHTYAVWVTRGVTAEDGSALEAPAALERLLSDVEPDDAALARAFAAYAPLRRHLKAEGIEPTTLATAAVFSVGELASPMTELAEAIEAAPAPSIVSDWVLCEEGVESPCPERSGARACGARAAEFDEYHAMVRLPSYQRGVAPFLQAGEGGGIDVSERPEAVDVCLALTVPTRAAPAEGFPLVVFAHGTGGSFRGHATTAVAGHFASGEVPFAVLGIDQVSHGSRRGGAQTPPETLFFNFLNPAAARGNPLQGAADQLSLARLAETLDGSGDEPVRIDASRLVFFGHSQGATQGSLAAPFAERYRAFVFSGNGASLQRALLTKKKPIDLRATLPLLLGDVPLDDMGFPAEYHPVLSLVQHWIDPADPLNFARALALEPLGAHGGRHVFQTYGLEDSYSPPQTLAAYVLAGGFAHVGPELQPLGLAAVGPPLTKNLDETTTLGFRQYQPSEGEDGHFVALDVPVARADVLRFFSTAVSSEAPVIGED